MKIVSGGQTGADRAALDVALEMNIPCGGHCPAGRIAEDGIIPEHYPLVESHSKDYSIRTRMNVVDSHATVIFTMGELKGGSLLTYNLCLKKKKPCLHIDGQKTTIDSGIRLLKDFIQAHFVEVLNVAGQRASHSPKIAEYTAKIMKGFIRSLA